MAPVTCVARKQTLHLRSHSRLDHPVSAPKYSMLLLTGVLGAALTCRIATHLSAQQTATGAKATYTTVTASKRWAL
jgi:hypothetical protein